MSFSVVLTCIPFSFRVAWLSQHQLSRIPERDAFPASRSRPVLRNGLVGPPDAGIRIGRRQTRAGTSVRGAGVQTVAPRSGGGAERRALTPVSTRARCASDDDLRVLSILPTDSAEDPDLVGRRGSRELFNSENYGSQILTSPEERGYFPIGQVTIVACLTHSV